MTDAAAQYKKQDGTLTVSADGNNVSWAPANDALSSLSIATAHIENIKQTPVTSANVSVKLIIKESSPQAGNYTFLFTSAAARDDQQTIVGLLRTSITLAKSHDISNITPAAGGGGATSAAMAIAQATTAAAKEKDYTYDDTKLLADLTLQMSLLNSSPALRQRFDRALQEKPESVSISQFSNQFWSTRVHMLRSHATERSQATGTYNVLSVIKSKTVNGALMLSLTKEQIELLFRQHPIVQKAYNENVPQLSEGDFWERFFHSRLMKKLKGERILEKDVLDPKLDKYLAYDETMDDSHELLLSSLPHFINVEGNENNHSQRQGNRPDFTMNPANYAKVPILRVLNRMSEKMMKDVAPSDASRHAPAGLDEETYKELQLKDLQRADEDNRVVLKVQDQSRLFSAGQSVQTSSSAATYKKRSPAQVLSTLQEELVKFSGDKTMGTSLDLHSTTKINDDSSSDDETTAQNTTRVGSRSSRSAATSQIISAIKKRHLHDDDHLMSNIIPVSELAKKIDLSETVLDNLIMTHNTTVEFLHYFWAVYHSGDPDRANEVAKLIETLDKSLDRIKAVAGAAEQERADKVEKLKWNYESLNQRNTKKRKFDPESVKGGANAVNQIVDPLFRAINAARSQYQKALQEQLG